MPRPLRNPLARHRRPRGIALLMALAVVMLLTYYMSEFFFSTGLELRAMTTFKESHQARNLARAAFKAVQTGLLLDETVFFTSYRQIQQLLNFGGAVPLEEGLLIGLDIQPLDGLYNLNALDNLQQSHDQDIIRQQIFLNTLADVEIPAKEKDFPPETLQTTTIAGLYAAIWDWIDTDNEDYTGFTGVRGAEADAYLNNDPEVLIKNAPLDRLSEVRLVRGVADSRIPWKDWEARFAAFPKRTSYDGLFPERINVNTASAAEIAAFLNRHNVSGLSLTSTTYRDVQTGIQQYVENAEDIAKCLVPDDAPRAIYDEGKLEQRIQECGTGLNPQMAKYLFSTVNEYYRITLVTEVDQIPARLQAVVKVNRDRNTRVGSSVKVLWWSVK